MRRLVPALLAVVLLAGCAGGTEQYRLDEAHRQQAQAEAQQSLAQGATGGTATTGSLGCRTAPGQLVRDWNRVLTAQGTAYEAQRISQLVADIDRSGKATGCPGKAQLLSFAEAARALHPPGDRAGLAAAAAAGNRWLAAQHRSDVRFAGP